MITLLNRVRRTVEKYGLLSRGDRVVVAVSGGQDSVALLRLLCDLRSEFDLTLHVAHLNHQLRPDAAEDAAFVREMAAGLNAPVTVESADVRHLAATQRRSVEDAGRQARYAFFERVAEEIGARRVATAHTRDDQIETVAMRLLQNAPWETLAGIPPARPLGRATVVRPLLEVPRVDLTHYLREGEIAWRDDPTNRDQRILRNWVRGTLLPALQAHRPQLSELLWQVGEAARREDRFLARLADEAYGHLARRDGSGVRLGLDGFRRLPGSVQRRVLRRAVAEVAGTDRALPYVQEGRVLRVGTAGRTGDEARIGGRVIRRAYDALEVVPPPPAPPQSEYRLPVPGTVTAREFGVIFTAEVMDRKAVPDPAAGRADEVYLSIAATGSDLRVRPWRHGDRFTPLGLRGQKKVQDFFVDEKVPRWDRSRIPLVVDARDRILWIVGYRIADAGKVTERTERVVRLRVSRLDS